ncbi:MAG: hypothetical protein IJV98_04735 [Clostridia bacterium]|nr:hypothetical protein [Clostridia bacterium]
MRKFFSKITALFKKSDVEKTSLQKTARFAIIFAAIALVGVIVYFAVVAPILNRRDEYVPELFPGEVYKNGAIYILRQYERTEIASIEVKNDLEHFKLNAYDMNGAVSFQIEGKEHIPLSLEKVSYFIADVRSLITNSPAGQERVTATATEENLKNYGLDEASDPAWFKVTLNDGTSYQVNVGNSLVTTTGYYVTLEGRKNVVDGVEYDIVYALQSSLASTVLSGSETLVSTELTTYDTNIYSASLFAIEKYKGEEREPVVIVGLVEDKGISASSSVYEMLYPASYVINEDDYGADVLTNLAYVNATEIVAYGDRVHEPEVYEKFGLDLDLTRLEEGTDKNYAMVYFSTAPTDTENYSDSLVFLYFSEKMTALDGTAYYYVYSPEKQVIGKVAAENFAFVEWSLVKYTNPYLFFEYFTSCDFFEIVSAREDLDYRFNLTGKERTRTATVTTKDGETVYTESGAPLTYKTQYVTSAQGVEYVGPFEIFRDLYYVLITRSLALYAEVDENVTSVGDEVVATLTVRTTPKDHPISYYTYDQNGNRGVQVRDEGGNILCHKVVVPTTLSDGTVKEISYDKAYYDEEAQRFFLKITDSNDANDKPAGFTVTSINTVKPSTFLPVSAYGEYKETTYSYEFYDLYDEYVDYNGNTVRQQNATYMYIVPTTTVKTYKLVSNGEKELIKTETERAEIGVYIRCATIDKLFSDTHKLLNGETIDTMGVN